MTTQPPTTNQDPFELALSTHLKRLGSEPVLPPLAAAVDGKMLGVAPGRRTGWAGSAAFHPRGAIAAFSAIAIIGLLTVATFLFLGGSGSNDSSGVMAPPGASPAQAAQPEASAVLEVRTITIHADGSQPNGLVRGPSQGSYYIDDTTGRPWRWRPSKEGGVLRSLKLTPDPTFGKDHGAVTAHDPDVGDYRLYVVEPSQGQIMRYQQSFDGRRFTPPSPYLASANRRIVGFDREDGDYVAEWTTAGPELDDVRGMYVTTERVGKKKRIVDTLFWITPQGLFEAPLTVPSRRLGTDPSSE